MLTQPATKYTAFTPIDLPDRTWPSKTITQPPIWLSTDLRDGNQALIEPMDIARKLRLFRLLVDIGFKEIEVGFPAASQTEFDFVRHLIVQNLIPDDVTIQVLTPARDALIRRSFEALRGAKRAIVHLYNATAPAFRQVVFGLDKPGTVRLATQAAALMRELAAAQLRLPGDFSIRLKCLPLQSCRLPKKFAMRCWRFGSRRQRLRQLLICLRASKSLRQIYLLTRWSG